ncbi:hypothetical protein ScPMuIL_003994 [Solemya velum]
MLISTKKEHAVPIRMSSRNTLKRQSAIILNDYLCQTWFEHYQAKRRKTDNLISNGNDDIVVCKCENVKENTGEVNITTDNVSDAIKRQSAGFFERFVMSNLDSDWPETYESRLILCPASLNTFFEKMGSTSSSASIEEIMIYEWNRFRSFVNFPRESPVYAIELSRAGFYHTGNRDEVVCFYCGARHSDWTYGDSPLRIHRHISPNCRFLNGNDTNNVRISHINSESQLDSSQVSLLGNGDGTPGHGNQTVHDPANTPTITTSRSGISTSNEKGRNFGQYRESGNSNGTTDVFGIFSQRPRYPRYAVLAIRISSFENWPRYSSISPQSLAQAGLFYIGFGDNVRCFFCGGGMRNWEPQDVPLG